MQTQANNSKEKFGTDSLIGLFCVLAGLGIGLILIPEYPFQAGNMRWPAGALAAGLLLGPFLSLRRSFLAGLQAENILMIGVAYWLLLELIEGSFPLFEVSRAVIVEAFLMVGLFAVGIWVGTGFFRPKKLPNILREIDGYHPRADYLFGFIVFCFLIGTLWFTWSCSFQLSCLWESLSGTRFVKPWWRVKLGGWRSLIEHTKYFGYLLPALTMLLWHIRKRLNWQVVCSLIFTAIFVLFVVRGGSRRIVGGILGAGIVTWALLKPHMSHGDIVKFIIACLLVLALMELMITYRRVGLDKIFSDQPIPEESNAVVNIDKNFLRLSQIVDIVPERHDYVYHQQLVWVLVRPIPRALWPGKPTGPGFFLPYEIHHFRKTLAAPEHIRRTLTSSVVGEWYLVAGWSTVLLGGIFTGILANLANSLLFMGSGPLTRIMYALTMMPMFVGVRAMKELVLMSYPILGLLVLIWLLRFLRRRRRLSTINEWDTEPQNI